MSKLINSQGDPTFVRVQESHLSVLNDESHQASIPVAVE
jgi:hypothetical protein